MGYINLGNSLRYGPTGKKRKSYYKTKSLSTKKRSTSNPTSKSSYKESDRMKQIREHKEKYPSMMESGMIRGNTHKPDNSYKKETSEKYTIAIGYNKGGYQVIPNKEIKDIGK